VAVISTKIFGRIGFSEHQINDRIHDWIGTVIDEEDTQENPMIQRVAIHQIAIGRKKCD